MGNIFKILPLKDFLGVFIICKYLFIYIEFINLQLKECVLYLENKYFNKHLVNKPYIF